MCCCRGFQLEEKSLGPQIKGVRCWERCVERLWLIPGGQPSSLCSGRGTLSVWSLVVLLCSETWGFSLLVTNGCQGWEPGRYQFRVIYSLINAVILRVLLV